MTESVSPSTSKATPDSGPVQQLPGVGAASTEEATLTIAAPSSGPGQLSALIPVAEATTSGKEAAPTVGTAPDQPEPGTSAQEPMEATPEEPVVEYQDPNVYRSRGPSPAPSATASEASMRTDPDYGSDRGLDWAERVERAEQRAGF